MSSVIIDSDSEESYEENAKSDLDAETELCKIDQEISDITKKIRNFEQRRRVLKLKAEKLREKIQQKECNALLEQDWERRRFSWSEQLDKAREEVFRISSYRPDQLAVMNASLSGHDCLLIIPTWGGASQHWQYHHQDRLE